MLTENPILQQKLKNAFHNLPTVIKLVDDNNMINIHKISDPFHEGVIQSYKTF